MVGSGRDDQAEDGNRNLEGTVDLILSIVKVVVIWTAVAGLVGIGVGKAIKFGREGKL